MDAFNLDARVSTPTSAGAPAVPASLTTLVTKTPVCSKFSCKCTLNTCTAFCRQ
ncbi:MAG: hypothetical protein ACRDRK_01720 [Pseudonocardia sp.]